MIPEVLERALLLLACNKLAGMLLARASDQTANLAPALSSLAAADFCVHLN